MKIIRENKEYDILFAQVRKIIEETDPVQIASFSPEDEFDGEIKEIIKLLERASNLNEFSQKIDNLFLHQFGEDILYKEKLKEMSERIWFLKNANKSNLL